VRQFLVGTVLAPSLVGFVWFAVFGGTALHLEIFRDVPLAEAVAANVSSTMFVMFDAMPMGFVMSAVATLLVFVFFVTSGDSATLVLGTMSTGGNPNPPNRVKIVWGVLVAAIALSLLLAGGLQAVQTATIVFALPFSLVLVLMAVSVTLAIREDWNAEQKRERDLRRKLRDMVRE
jgi:glycine betaine transporter